MEGKRLGAAAVVLNEQNEILMVKHSYGKLNWEIPGGHAEPDESAAQTAVRETFEETRLRVEAGRLTGIYYEPSIDMHHMVFLCRSQGADSPPKPDLDEITESRYWPLDQLPRPISDFTIRRIKEALSGQPAAFAVIGERQWLV